MNAFRIFKNTLSFFVIDVPSFHMCQIFRKCKRADVNGYKQSRLWSNFGVLQQELNKTVYKGKSMGSDYNYCQQGPLINKKETLW